MLLMGLPRVLPPLPPPGWSAGERRICSGRSGDALIRSQSSPLAETARLAWVRDFTRRSPDHANWHAGHRQFHCGKPPPAAEPSTIARRRLISQGMSDLGRQIAVDFEAEADFYERRCGPSHGLLLCDSLTNAPGWDAFQTRVGTGLSIFDSINQIDYL